MLELMGFGSFDSTKVRFFDMKKTAMAVDFGIVVCILCLNCQFESVVVVKTAFSFRKREILVDIWGSVSTISNSLKWKSGVDV